MVPVKYSLLLLTVLLLTSEISTKRSSGGRRKTGSGSSSSGWGWSRPKTDSKPHSNPSQTSHSNVENTRLSYGSDSAPSAPKPAQSNPGWVVPNTNQQKNVGWNTNSNPGQSNVGWNAAKPVGSNPNPSSNVGWSFGTNQNPSSNVGLNNNQQKPIGWNVPNSQGGYNQPKPGQQPPPYPGGNSQRNPPPYPGGNSQQNPPPYNPGYTNNQRPGYNNAPPPYSGYGGQNQAPPPYPGYGTGNRYGGGYSNTHNSYGYNPYPQQGHGSWGSSGFGSPSYGSPFGGGFGNRGGMGGGFGGYGGGYNPSGFGYKKKSGFGLGSFATHAGTFFAGAMLMNLASNIGRSNYQVYHNTPQKYTYSDPSGRNEYNVTHDTTKPNEAKMSVDFGNMSCITIYNSAKFQKWANRTIKHVEYQTKQAFPFGNIANLQNGSASGQIQLNFTMEPGRIIHNETVSITCCGTDHLALDFEEILSGKDPNANCVHLAAQVPFREIKVIPLNVTVNITAKDIEKLVNETAEATTEVSGNSTSNTTIVDTQPVTLPIMQLLTTTISPNITLVEQNSSETTLSVETTTTQSAENITKSAEISSTSSASIPETTTTT